MTYYIYEVVYVKNANYSMKYNRVFKSNCIEKALYKAKRKLGKDNKIISISLKI